MNKKEALELCGKFGIDHAEHPNIVVTSTGNIYPTGIVDPSDKGEIVDLSESKKEVESPKAKK